MGIPAGRSFLGHSSGFVDRSPQMAAHSLTDRERKQNFQCAGPKPVNEKIFQSGFPLKMPFLKIKEMDRSIF